MTHETGPELALGTFSIASGSPFGALVVDGWAVGLAALCSDSAPLGVGLCSESVLGVLEAWPEQLPRLEHAARIVREHTQALSERRRILHSAELFPHAPFLPRRLFCTGANYRGHVAGLIRGDASMRAPGREHEDPQLAAARVEAELDRRAKTGKPYCFSKLACAVIGPNDQLTLPKDVEKPDWELELAVVIGRACRRVAARDAMRYVAGYAIINDVTARDLVFRRDGIAIGADWLAAKSQPGFAPFGPWLVPADQVRDVYKLQLQLSVNGKLMQNENTSDMLIDIARQVEHLSNIVHLQPGDVIATGSPAGNGSMHGVFLKPGDLMEGTITGLGTQRIRCVAEP